MNYAADKEKWEVDYDGEVCTFLMPLHMRRILKIIKRKPMSMGEEKCVEVEYQAGRLVPLSNEKIDAMKKDYFYAEILHRG